MSKELDELFAMSCPDLKTNGDTGNQIVVLETHRRLSTIKQMTATELAAARAAAAAAAELEETLEIARQAEIEKIAMEKSSIKLAANRTPSKSPRKVQFEQQIATTANENDYINDDDDDFSNDNKSKLLPTLHAPRDRITSLPNILDEGMEAELLALSGNLNINSNASPSTSSSLLKPQLELHSAESLYSKSEETEETTLTLNVETEEEEEEEELVISSKSSNEDFETPNTTSIADSIELLRMQRRERGGRNERERERERSLSPNSLRLRHDHERSAAPDRLHSSSISSIGSAASASACSISASTSVNASKNVSRRNSTASIAGELLAANQQLPPTPPTTAPTTPLSFPISKTSSTPNMQRRKSSLSALFPGPSPLVAPEPVVHSDPKAIELLVDESKKHIDRNEHREIPTGKFIHRTKTPPPVGVKLGVNLKRVTPPKTQITVKKNDAPMLGVVLRKVEKKIVPQKSILDDDKPLYHFSIVRSDHKEYKPSDQKPKPKPTNATLQKSSTTSTVTAKPNSGGIFSGPQVVRTAKGQQQPVVYKPQRPQPGVPITIQKIEGDKVIIIKKIYIPKNSKIPEQYKVGERTCYVMCCDVLSFHVH